MHSVYSLGLYLSDDWRFKTPLAENIDLTKRVLRAARVVGVPVEAELGKIGGTEDDIVVSEREAFFTDPQEAKEFVSATGVDSLAKIGK